MHLGLSLPLGRETSRLDVATCWRNLSYLTPVFSALLRGHCLGYPSLFFFTAATRHINRTWEEGNQRHQWNLGMRGFEAELSCQGMFPILCTLGWSQHLPLAIWWVILWHGLILYSRSQPILFSKMATTAFFIRVWWVSQLQPPHPCTFQAAVF